MKQKLNKITNKFKIKRYKVNSYGWYTGVHGKKSEKLKL